MADSVNPVPPEAAGDIASVGDAAQKAASDITNMSETMVNSRESFSGMASTMLGVNNMFSQLGSSMRGFGVSLKEIGSLTAQQKEQFTLVSAAVVGARVSFEGLANVDHTGISTFTGQLQELMSTLKNEGPLTSKAIEGLTSLSKSAGASDSAIAQAAKGGVAGLSALAQSMLTAADNGLRLQNAVLQMAGATGNLDEAFKLAGPNLENMNALLSKHQDVITQAGAATGLPTAQIEKYYAQLGAIPQSLGSLVKGSGDANSSVNMLAATMKVATGTGRNFSDVVDDLKIAFKEYGLVGEDALKFSAQMSKVANNLGVEMNVVKSALSGTADTFKMFATSQKDATAMASGFANMLNTYAAALEHTGFSGTQAVEVVKSMIGQMGNLNIAQKSFLSAQSGGAGGLMGGFQIERMMREDPAKVMKMIQDQLRKTSGPVVTHEQAEQSEGAARQYQKQLLMLQQGPFGSLAKGPQEAERLLAALGDMEKGGGAGAAAKALSPDVVQDSMKQGTAIQEKSYTVLTEINQGIAALRGETNIGALGMMQKGMAAGTGAGVGEGDSSKIGAHLRDRMRAGGEMNAEQASASLAASYKQKELINTSGRSAATAINGLIDTFSKDTMVAAIKQPLDVLKKAFSTPGKAMGEDVAKAKDALVKDIAKRKADAQSLPLNERNKLIEDIKKEQDAVDKIDAAQSAMGAKPAAVGPGVKPPGAQVGAAANRAAAVKSAPPGGAAVAAGGSVNVPAGGKQDVTVHVTGFCLKCKQEIEGGNHAKGVNKASTVQ